MSSVWEEYRTDEGHLYYFNRVTNESSWTKPASFQPASDVKAEPNLPPVVQSNVGTDLRLLRPASLSSQHPPALNPIVVQPANINVEIAAPAPVSVADKVRMFDAISAPDAAVVAAGYRSPCPTWLTESPLGSCFVRSKKWILLHRVPFGIGAVCVLVLIIGLAVGLRASPSPSTAAETASSSLNSFSSTVYDPSTNQLSFNSASMVATPSILNLISQSLNTSAAVFRNVVPLASLPPSSKALSTIPWEFAQLAAQSIQNKYFSSEFDVFGIPAQCLIMLFFNSAADLSPSAVQLAILCQFQNSFDLTNIPALAASQLGSQSWLSSFTLQSSTQIMISTASMSTSALSARPTPSFLPPTSLSDISSIPAPTLPAFVEKGINIYSSVALSNTGSLRSVFPGVVSSFFASGALSVPISCRISIPLDPNSVFPDISMSANAPVKAILSIPTSALSNFTATNSPRIQFFGNTANVYLEGLSRSNLTAFALQGNLVFDFRPVSSASLIPSVGAVMRASVMGTVDLEAGTVLLSGSLLGDDWVPFAGFSSQTLPYAAKVLSSLSFSTAETSFSALLNLGTTLSINSINVQASAGIRMGGLQFNASSLLQIDGSGRLAAWISAAPLSGSINSFAADLLSGMTVSNSSLARQVLANMLNELGLSNVRSVDLLISTYTTAVSLGGFSITNGVSFGVNGNTLNRVPIATAFSGGLSSLTSLFESSKTSLSGQLSVGVAVLNFGIFSNTATQFNLKLTIPAISTSFASFPSQVSVSNFVVTINSGYSASLGATISCTVPSFAAKFLGDNSTVQLAASAVWTSSNQQLQLSAVMSGATVFPFGTRWISLSQLSAQLTMSIMNNALTLSSLQMSTQVSFSTGQGPSASIPMSVSFSRSGVDASVPVFVLTAASIPLASLVPQLAAQIGNPSVTAVVSNLAFPYSPSVNILPGLNFFASNLALQPDAFQGALDTFNARGNQSFDVAVPVADAFLIGRLQPSLETISVAYSNPSAQLTSLFSMQAIQVQATVAFNPAPASYSMSLAAILSASVPYFPSINTSIQGSFRADGSSRGFILTGSLPAWSNVFGFSWLSMDATIISVRCAVQSSVTRIVSIRSTLRASGAGFGFAAPVCGILSDAGSALVASVSTTATVNSLTSLLCSALGACNLPSSSLLSEFLNHFTQNGGTIPPIGIALASADLPASAWQAYAAACQLSMVPQRGISFYSNLPPFQSLLKHIGGKVLSNSTVAAIKQWSASLRAPLSLAQDISKLEFSLQNDKLSLRLGPSVLMTSIGVKAAPFPTPGVTAWTRLVVTLQNQPAPLEFQVSGRVDSTLGGTITLSGVLQVPDPGWINPFGLTGLIVKTASLSVGFDAATVVDSLALSFSATLGSSIAISFAGSVSVANAGHTYLRGSISGLGASFGLRDLLLAVNAMSNDLIPVPSWLPSPSVFALSAASFSIATASGTDPTGTSYPAGLAFSATGSLLAVNFSVSAALVQVPVAALGFARIPDLQLSFTANFDALNAAAAAWLRSKNFNAVVTTWLAKNRLLCDLICVKSVSITGFSAVGIAQGEFPNFSFTISVLGITHTFSSLSLTSTVLSTWSFSSVLDSVRASLGSLTFCIIDANCPSATPICDNTQNFQCVASCRTGYVHILDGCLRF